MNMSLSLRHSTHLTMTPLLQRSIQLLQLSSLEFVQQVEEVVADNPFLDRLETAPDDPSRNRADGGGIESETLPSLSAERLDGPLDDTAHDRTNPEAQDAMTHAPGDELGQHTDPDSGFTQDESGPGPQDDTMWADSGESGHSSAAPDGEAVEGWPQVGRKPSLREHLREQAGLLRLSPRDRVLVETVIDAIDPGGYLRASLEEIGACCPVDPVADADELRIALRHVQSMDPPGVGARDVAECLLLQLQEQDRDRQDAPIHRLANTIVTHHLNELAQHDFGGLQRTLGCSAADLQAAVHLLRSLVPRPGSSFDNEPAQFVVADVIVRRHAGRWTAFINPQVVPRLRIHRRNLDLMRGIREPEGQIAQCMKEARWMVRNVQQRFQTIQQVAQAIVDHQSRYFDYGEMAMRPLTLAEIAALTGMHESTVSRVTSRKYMSTPHGLLEFKRFFGSHVSTAAGTPCSATAVRAVIQELVQAEDPQAPLSDIRLARLLEQRGIHVARRTVSKYRDGLRIAPVEMRRMTGAHPLGR